MSEEEKTQGQEQTEGAGDGNKSESTSIVAQANEAAKRLEEQNKRMEENLRRQEDLAAKNALGGQTDSAKNETKKEETPEEYTKRVEKQIAEGKVDRFD